MSFCRRAPRQIGMARPSCRLAGAVRPAASSLHAARSFATATVLGDRGVLKVEGADSFTFLQGLTTNDTRLLASAVSSEEEADDTDAASAWGGLCQFTSMLHPKGRVLWEMFAWAHPQLGNETVLLECDTAVLPLLQKRLRMFKLRAAVELSDVSDEYKVLAVLGASDEDVMAYTDSAAAAASALATADPRCRQIGHRLLLPAAAAELSPPGDEWLDCGPEGYRNARIQLGLLEGMAEIESDKLFPAELGLDYLNGVSFAKGCYVGQELTARTHFQGMVRKRLLPCFLYPQAPSTVAMGRSTFHECPSDRSWKMCKTALRSLAEPADQGGDGGGGGGGDGGGGDENDQSMDVVAVQSKATGGAGRREAKPKAGRRGKNRAVGRLLTGGGDGGGGSGSGEVQVAVGSFRFESVLSAAPQLETQCGRWRVVPYVPPWCAHPNARRSHRWFAEKHYAEQE